MREFCAGKKKEEERKKKQKTKREKNPIYFQTTLENLHAIIKLITPTMRVVRTLQKVLNYLYLGKTLCSDLVIREAGGNSFHPA